MTKSHGMSRESGPLIPKLSGQNKSMDGVAFIVILYLIWCLIDELGDDSKLILFLGILQSFGSLGVLLEPKLSIGIHYHIISYFIYSINRVGLRIFIIIAAFSTRMGGGLRGGARVLFVLHV